MTLSILPSNFLLPFLFKFSATQFSFSKDYTEKRVMFFYITVSSQIALVLVPVCRINPHSSASTHGSHNFLIVFRLHSGISLTSGTEVCTENSFRRRAEYTNGMKELVRISSCVYVANIYIDPTFKMLETNSYYTEYDTKYMKPFFFNDTLIIFHIVIHYLYNTVIDIFSWTPDKISIISSYIAYKNFRS